MYLLTNTRLFLHSDCNQHENAGNSFNTRGLFPLAIYSYNIITRSWQFCFEISEETITFHNRSNLHFLQLCARFLFVIMNIRILIKTILEGMRCYLTVASI